MPTITKLKAQKRAGYFNIFIDEAFWCGLSDLQISTMGLRRGQELSQAEADALLELADSSKSYNAALRFLSFRIRTRREVSDYLKKKGYEEHIAETLDRLEREKYVNDTDFTERWVAMRQAEGKSPRAISYELMRKGIDRQLVDAALAEYDADVRQDSLRRLLTKKRATGKSLEKITQSLQRQGWAWGEIQTALREDAD